MSTDTQTRSALAAVRAFREASEAISPFAVGGGPDLMLHAEHIDPAELPAVLADILAHGGRWEDNASQFADMPETFRLWLMGDTVSLCAGFCFRGEAAPELARVLQWRAEQEANP